MTLKWVKLSNFGLALGDVVTFALDDQSTGGIIFEIAENFDSPIDPEKRREFVRDGRYLLNRTRLTPMQVDGYMRLRPLFEFFPTELGKNPKGKGGTVLVYHFMIERVKKIDVLSLGSKYVELGNLIRDVAIKHGMVNDPSTDSSAHDSPPENIPPV